MIDSGAIVLVTFMTGRLEKTPSDFSTTDFSSSRKFLKGLMRLVPAKPRPGMRTVTLNTLRDVDIAARDVTFTLSDLD